MPRGRTTSDSKYLIIVHYDMTSTRPHHLLLLLCKLLMYVYNHNNNSTTGASLHLGAGVVVIVERDSVKLAF